MCGYKTSTWYKYQTRQACSNLNYFRSTIYVCMVSCLSVPCLSVLRLSWDVACERESIIYVFDYYEKWRENVAGHIELAIPPPSLQRSAAQLQAIAGWPGFRRLIIWNVRMLLLHRVSACIEARTKAVAILPTVRICGRMRQSVTLFQCTLGPARGGWKDNGAYLLFSLVLWVNVRDFMDIS